jgi:serine acetyltransferase
VGHPATRGDVIIGNDVWIGDNVTIMSGSHIGDGAVISANTAVSCKIKPYSVVGGNPAQFLFYRFNKEIREKLLELKWWNFTDEQINEISPILCSNDFNLLFKICEKWNAGMNS